MLFILTSTKSDTQPLIYNSILKKEGVAYKVLSLFDFQAYKGPKPKAILCLGMRAVNVFVDLKIIPKNRTINSLRTNHGYSYQGIPLFISYDKYSAAMDHNFQVMLEMDLSVVNRFMRVGSILPVIGHYTWVPDFKDQLKEISHLIQAGDTPKVTLDLETVGLDEFKSDAFIVSIFITLKEKTAQGIRFEGLHDQPAEYINGDLIIKNKELYSQIKWILTCSHIKLVGANLKYDNRWMMHKWGLRAGDNFVMDTTLVGSLLDENASNSLSNHAHRYTSLGGYDDDLNKNWDKSRMDLIPDQDLLTYAGGDTDATYQVSDVLKEKIINEGDLARFYIELLHPAARAFEIVENEGICIDIQYFADLRAEVAEAIENLEKEALVLIPAHIRLKHRGFERDGRPKLRLGRSVILKEFLFGPRGLKLKPPSYTPKAKEKTWAYASTSMDHLKQFSEDKRVGPFIKTLKEYNSASKTLSTFIDGFLEHLREDGRFHPTFMLYRGGYGADDTDSGTVTGRCLRGDVEIQTSEGKKQIKDMVGTYDHKNPHTVLSSDGNFHSVTAAMKSGKQKVYKITTKSGKVIYCTGNHPLLSTSGKYIRADASLHKKVVVKR